MRLTSNPAATHSGGTRLLLGPRGSAALMSPLEPPSACPLVRLGHRAGRSQAPGGPRHSGSGAPSFAPEVMPLPPERRTLLEGGICSHSVSETKKKRRMPVQWLVPPPRFPSSPPRVAVTVEHAAEKATTGRRPTRGQRETGDGRLREAGQWTRVKLQRRQKAGEGMEQGRTQPARGTKGMLIIGCPIQ